MSTQSLNKVPIVNEELLIHKLLNNDMKDVAYSELLDLYQEKLYWHIRKIVITHDNANDVLQNTFIRVFKNISNFKQKSSLQTWLYRIAYNESIRFLEQNKKHTITQSIDNNDYYLKDLTQDSYFDGDELKLQLHKSLAKLTDKQRLVFQMKYYDNLSFRQISEIVNISENTLKSTYYSAEKKIKDKIVSLVI